MTSAPTVSTMAARAVILTVAMKHGIAPPELCARVGLDPELVADVDGRIPAPLMGALWDAAAALDSDFGLHLGESAVGAHFTLPWHLLRSAPTLRDGIMRLVAAWRVFNDFEPLPEVVLPTRESRAVDATVRLRWDNAAVPVPRHAFEFMFAWFVNAVRRATGRSIDPGRVSFEHPRPSSTAEHARIFNCSVEFDAEAASLVYPKEILELPTVAPDPELDEVLSRHVDALTAMLPARDGFASDVRTVALPLLATGELTIDAAARALGSNARTVQRRLKDEGTTFQKVIAALRSEVAMAYLREGTHSLGEIALLVGFGDPTSFHRAFLKWTGRTPGEYRRDPRVEHRVRV